MAFCDVRWFSPTLEKQVASYVLLPDKGDGPFPVLYLLHGLSDDHTIWHRRTRIEHYVRNLPLIIVMPDGFRNFYTNNHAGRRYADYVARDVVGFVERAFPARRSRDARCIGGLSMGGYGALRLALGYPDLFCSAHSHSGAVLAGRQPTREGIPEWTQVFGPSPAGTDHDLIHLAERCKRGGTLPHLLLDCGTDDFLYQDNVTFHRELTKLGVPHTYCQHPGSHDWDYWDLHVREALAFHCRNLQITAR